MNLIEQAKNLAKLKEYATAFNVPMSEISDVVSLIQTLSALGPGFASKPKGEVTDAAWAELLKLAGKKWPLAVDGIVQDLKGLPDDVPVLQGLLKSPKVLSSVVFRTLPPGYLERLKAGDRQAPKQAIAAPTEPAVRSGPWGAR